jgi:hypothetical protein
MWLRVIALLFGTFFLMSVDLPPQGPLPIEKPDEKAPAKSAAEPEAKSEKSGKQEKPATEVPIPVEKPQVKTDGKAPEKADEKKTDDKKTDLPASETAKEQQGSTPDAATEVQGPKLPAPDAAAPANDASKTEEPEGPKLTVMPEDPEALKQCLADLTAIGSVFQTGERIDDGDGCGIDKPVVVKEIVPGVKLNPTATVRCETALQLARWTKEMVLPAAAKALTDSHITAINEGSIYACRLRNSATTGKISEHARGNGVDVASFSLSDGKTIPIKPRDKDSTLEGAFQRAVTAVACLYFTTVLAPGSDAAHEDHLHLDVIERKGGYRYCW